MTEISKQSPETPDLPQGPGTVFTFIYYFSGAALIAVLFTAKTLGVGFNAGIVGQSALLVGGVSGLLGTFYNRTKMLKLEVTQPKAFMRKLAETLMDMGYTLTETLDDISLYRRSGLGKFFAGDIYVQRQDNAVILVSRAANIRTLAKRLG
ncbi:MAG: hypothetical protein AAFQ89_11500 [Cyanobacteria bacterium J06626_18]